MFRGDQDDKEKPEDHLRQQLAFAKDMGARDGSILNSIVAKNVLHEDLGRFDSFLPRYNLDEDTRDRLIVHARQDAAHAVINTAALLDQLGTLWRTLRLILSLVLVLIFMVLAPIIYVLVVKN